MPVPQCPHLSSPTSGAGEDTTRGGTALGLQAARRFAARSKAPASMIAGTETAFHSGCGRSFLVLESRRLK